MFTRFSQLFTRFLPLVGVIAGIAIVVFALSQWWYVRDAVNDGAQLQEILKKGKADEYFSAKLDLYNRRADDVRNLLVYLLAIGGFITTLQGLFAYFNVQNFNKQAEEAMKKLDTQGSKTVEDLKTLGNDAVSRLAKQGDEAVKNLEAIRVSAEAAEAKAQQRLKSVEEQLPVFAQMDRVIKAAVSQLELFFKEPDTFTDIFDTTTSMDRQRIVYYERSVAGLEFTELPQLNKSLANIYRGLAIFYASKQFKELAVVKERGWTDGPEVERLNGKEDLARARFYAELARRKSDNPFCVENDLGWMAAREGNLDLSAEHCRRSLALEPNQQRALTNLAICQLRRKDYREAITLLRKAKACEFWELDRRDLKSRVCYNLACALARFAKENPPEEGRFLDEALVELDEMLDYPVDGLREFLEDDLKNDGDFAPLMADPVRRPLIEAIRARMTKPTKSGLLQSSTSA